MMDSENRTPFNEAGDGRAALNRSEARKWLGGIALFFLVMLMANGALVFYSQHTWNGLTDHNHYRNGLAFNRVLEASRAQRVMGWRAALDAGGLVAGRTGQLSFGLVDAQGAPVSGARVTGQLFRPAHEGRDQALILTESQPGLYAANLVPPLPGQWDIKLRAVTDEADFRFVERIRVADAPGE